MWQPNATGVYVVGWTGGTLPGQPEQAAPGQADAFVVKFDANGALQWTRQIGTIMQNGVVANAVGVDATGVYVAGNVNCCATPLVVAHRNGGADGFLRKYAPDGTELWTRQFGTGNSEQATAVFVDATGIYVAGTTGGDMTVTNRVGPARTIDGFFLKFNPDGDELLGAGSGVRSCRANRPGRIRRRTRRTPSWRRRPASSSEDGRRACSRDRRRPERTACGTDTSRGSWATTSILAPVSLR